MKKTFIVLSFMFISTILFATPIDDLYSSLLFNEDTLWISEQSLRILKSSDKNTIKEYYPDIETLNYYDDAEGRVIQWDESECFTSFTIFPHLYRDKDVISITYGQITDLLSFYFSYKSMSENYYYIDTTMTFNCKKIVNQNAFSKWPIHEDECIMILQFDGDYLNVYLNDLKNYYGTFCKIDKKTLDEYNSLISTGKSNLSRVTWPRHADGTCDYDDEIKPPTLQLSDNDSFSEVEEISVSPEFILESDVPEISDEETPATTSVNKQAALLSVIIALAAAIILIIVVILTVIIVRKKRRK